MSKPAVDLRWRSRCVRRLHPALHLAQGAPTKPAEAVSVRVEGSHWAWRWRPSLMAEDGESAVQRWARGSFRVFEAWASVLSPRRAMRTSSTGRATAAHAFRHSDASPERRCDGFPTSRVCMACLSLSLASLGGRSASPRRTMVCGSWRATEQRA